MQTTVIIFAFLIGLLYLVIIRSFDRYEKESLVKLITSLLVGGIVSVFVSFLLYYRMEVEENFTDAIIKIGLVEELSKMAGFLVVYLLFRRSVNEIVDGLVYMSAVALGFATIENILYALSAAEPFRLLLGRAVYSVAGHLSFAGYMGIALFIHLKRHRNWAGIIISLVLASLAHGLYDGVLFVPSLNSLFHYLFLVIVLAHIYLYKVVLSFSRYRPSVSIELFRGTGRHSETYCPRCERSREMEQIRLNSITTHSCPTCKAYTFDQLNWIRFIRFFRPIVNARHWTTFVTGEFSHRKSVELDAAGGVVYDSDSATFWADQGAVRVWINHHNGIDQGKVLGIPVIGWLLGLLGLRYLVPAA